jgi:hypothetical protein
MKLAPAFATVLLAIIVAGALVAQQPQFEYGRPAEMRGLTHFFLDTQGNLKRRNQIIEAIQKKLPGLTFTDSADEAQALIVYTEVQSIRLAGGTSVPELTCTAYAALPLAHEKARLLFSYTMKKDNMFERAPYKNFAAEFVKAYREANVDLSKNPYYRQMTGQDKQPPN